MNEIFDKIYYINMDHRTDRREVCEAFFDEHKITAERIPGINLGHGSGPAGCAQSHVNAVKAAKEAGAKNVLIFEDDFEFLNYDIELIKEAFNELPPDWNMFYLGYNPTAALIPYGHFTYRITGAYCAHAVAINYNFYDWIIDNHYVPIDVFYEKCHPNFMCFGIKPMLCTQAAGISDIDYRDNDNRRVIIENAEGYERIAAKWGK